MTTKRDALELLADLRAHLEAYPNDTGARDVIRRLVREIDGTPEPRTITLSTWVNQPEPEPRKWLVKAWLPAGRVALLTGPGGVGKSRLVLQLAAGIASGGHDQEDAWIEAPSNAMDLGAGVGRQGSPVVYASWEDEPEETWRRLSAISSQTAAPWVTPERLTEFHVADMAGHGPGMGAQQRPAYLRAGHHHRGGAGTATALRRKGGPAAGPGPAGGRLRPETRTHGDWCGPSCPTGMPGAGTPNAPYSWWPTHPRAETTTPDPPTGRVRSATCGR